MRAVLIHTIIPILLSLMSAAPLAAGGETAVVRDLGYEDKAYLALSASTAASKNRMLRKQRRETYEAPALYSYTLKPREDIWNIIAKTSLNIDSIATLNRLDFIGMVRQGVTVYLPDTLGVFVEAEGGRMPEAPPVPDAVKSDLARRYGVKPDDVVAVGDPVKPGGTLYFVPEAVLSFLERSYLSGVVFHSPIVGLRTSGYGERVDPFVNETAFHGGVDIAAAEGRTVRASRGGTVAYAGERNGYGKLVVLRHELGYHTLYGHLKDIAVSAGENVETGQALGTVGTTGRTTGPHLHFEIRRAGRPLNPDHIPFLLEHTR